MKALDLANRGHEIVWGALKKHCEKKKHFYTEFISENHPNSIKMFRKFYGIQQIRFLLKTYYFSFLSWGKNVFNHVT